MRTGYARASTVRQSLDTQADSLKASGVTRVFAEKISTRAVTRPELDKTVALAREIRASGAAVTIVVHEHKRLGRGTALAALAGQPSVPRRRQNPPGPRSQFPRERIRRFTHARRRDGRQPGVVSIVPPERGELVIKRILAALAPLLLVPLAVAIGGPAQAVTYSAAPLTDQATGLCLYSYQAGQAAGVSARSCQVSVTEYWHMVPTDHFGDVHIVLDTGWCLDSDYNGSIATRACNGGTFQTWEITPNDASGSSPSQIKDVATGRCLDSNANGNVYTLACNGGQYQRWQQPISGFNLQNSLTGSGAVCVGIDYYSGLAGAWNCAYNPDQTWHWGATNQRGYSQLINGNHQCLGIQNRSTAQGADVQARGCDGGADQYWARTDEPYETFSRLLNYNSNLVIGILGGGTANGTPLVQWGTGGGDQWWSSPTTSFNITNSNALGKCVGSDAYSGLAGLWNCSTHPDQIWHWGAYNGQGYNQLIDDYGMCLGIQSGSGSAGANVQAAPCSGRSDQYWRRSTDTSPPYYYDLQNFKSMLVMGVVGGSTSNGAALVQGPSGSADQHWSGP